jgi:hypothetical protein
VARLDSAWPAAVSSESESKIFDGILPVAFSQAYVASDINAVEPDVSRCYLHQRNGLLGAAMEGVLFLTTGKGDGEVQVSVHVADRQPPLNDSWEECVEASFTPATPVVALFDWDGDVLCEIRLSQRTHRVRYTARGMDAGHAGTETDVYGLWFWPAPAAPDVVIKQTSARAAYWHSERTRINKLLQSAE